MIPIRCDTLFASCDLLVCTAVAISSFAGVAAVVAQDLRGKVLAAAHEVNDHQTWEQQPLGCPRGGLGVSAMGLECCQEIAESSNHRPYPLVKSMAYMIVVDLANHLTIRPTFANK